MNFKQEPYKFLSNMHLCPVLLDGVVYPSAENAYQASKTKDRELFTTLNPYEAKKLGRKVQMIPDFDRLASMEKVLRSKFSLLNPTLRTRLGDTTVELVEENTWNDTYFGVCRGVGENHLGKLLMKIREDIQQGQYHFTKSEWDTATSIYEKLGESKRIILRPWYGRKGAEQAKAKGYVYTMRVPGMKYHLGNPYTPDTKLQGLFQVPTVKEAVIAYIAWVLFSYEERAMQIRIWLSQGAMKGKTLVYYKDLGEPSHAHALEWLIDNWR